MRPADKVEDPRLVAHVFAGESKSGEPGCELRGDPGLYLGTVAADWDSGSHESAGGDVERTVHRLEVGAGLKRADQGFLDSGAIHDTDRALHGLEPGKADVDISIDYHNTPLSGIVFVLMRMRVGARR